MYAQVLFSYDSECKEMEQTPTENIEKSVKNTVESMEKVSSAVISRSFARMFARYQKRKAGNRHPDCTCRQCGAQAWEPEVDDIWYCFRCGSRGYWTNGVFTQGGRRAGNG